MTGMCDQSDQGEKSPTYILPARQSQSRCTIADKDVVINELMLKPVEGGPWIEIHNNGTETISVDDWLISDEDELTFQFSDLPAHRLSL